MQYFVNEKACLKYFEFQKEFPHYPDFYIEGLFYEIRGWRVLIE